MLFLRFACAVAFGGGALLSFNSAAQADVLRDLLPCPYDYEAEVCASEINPGFEFVPVDGQELYTGEQPVGKLITFRIEVEMDSVADVYDVLEAAETILGDYRGWTGKGDYRFKHLASAKPDLAILIASPETVDLMCAPLDTEGFFSCRNGERAILNINRWQNAVPHWTSSLEEYRSYLLNHEVGHFLGEGHKRCPKAGEPAPVMQQQSIDLGGCEPNGWPFH